MKKVIVVLLVLGLMVFGLTYQPQASIIPIQQAVIQQSMAVTTVGDLRYTFTVGTLTKTTAGVHLKLEDLTTAETVIDQEFTETYTFSSGLTVAVRNAIGKKMQTAIDEYKELKTLRESAGFTGAPAILEGQLSL